MAAAAALFCAMVGNPNRMTPGCTQAIALSQPGGTATIMGNAAQPGTALTATAGGLALTDGGTFTPGSIITVANEGGGQYGIYTTAGTFTGATLCNGMLLIAGGTLEAPATPTLTLVGMRAPNSGTPVTYERITLNQADGGGEIVPPPGDGLPPDGLLLPPPPPPKDSGDVEEGDFIYSSPDGRHTIRWEPKPEGMEVTVEARLQSIGGTPPGWVGFAGSTSGSMLGPGGSNLAVVGMELSGIGAYLMAGKDEGLMTTLDPTSALLACGVSTIGSSVSVLGNQLIMTFTLNYAPDGIEAEANLCTPSIGQPAVRSLAVPRDAKSVPIIVASGASPTFSYHNAYVSANALSVDGSSSAGSSRSALVAAHGLIMATSWLLLAPLGIFASRYGRAVEPEGWWFKWHKRLLLSASVLTFVGFFIAVAMVDSSFASVHGKLGLFFFLLLPLQPIGGLLRPNKTSRRRPLWYAAHKFLGMSLPLLGFALCLLGSLLTAFQTGLFIVIFLYLLLLALWVAYKEIRDRRGGLSKQRKTSTKLPSEWSAAVDPTSGREYYVHKTTGLSQWERPAREAEAGAPPPPSAAEAEASPWVEATDPATTKKYYYNVQTGETSWTQPS